MGNQSHFQELARAKLDAEYKEFKGGQKERAVKKAMYGALLDFCRQDEEFAQAVVQNDKTLSACAAKVMAGVGSSVSDLEVYRRAVAFYFPGADIRMTMTVDLCAAVDKEAEALPDKEPEEAKKPGLMLDLSDFL